MSKQIHLFRLFLIGLMIFSQFSLALPTSALQQTQEISVAEQEVTLNDEIVLEEETLTKEEADAELIPEERTKKATESGIFIRTGLIVKKLDHGFLMTAKAKKIFRIDATDSTVIIKKGQKVKLENLEEDDKVRVFGFKHPGLPLIKAKLIRVIPGHWIAVKGTIQEIQSGFFFMISGSGNAITSPGNAATSGNREFRVDVSPKTLIIKNGEKVTLEDLAVGDRVRVFGWKHFRLPIIQARLVVVKKEPLIGSIEKVLSPGSFLLRSGKRKLRVDLDSSILKAKKDYLKNLKAGQSIELEGEVAHPSLPILRLGPSGLIKPVSPNL